jgi:hypothetical protein
MPGSVETSCPPCDRWDRVLGVSGGGLWGESIWIRCFSIASRLPGQLFFSPGWQALFVAVRARTSAYECEASAIDSSRTEILAAPLLIMASGSWERRQSVHKAKRWSRKPGDLFAFKANFHGERLADGLLPLAALFAHVAMRPGCRQYCSTGPQC